MIKSSDEVCDSGQAALDAVNFVTVFAGKHDRLCMSIVISLRKCLVWSVCDLPGTYSEATHCRVRRLTRQLTSSGYKMQGRLHSLSSAAVASL